jgi:hypothetical protein
VRYGGVFAPNFKRRDEVILVPGRRKRKVSVGQVDFRIHGLDTAIHY